MLQGGDVVRVIPNVRLLVKISALCFSLIVFFLTFGMWDVLAQERAVIIHHDVGLRACPALECQVVAQLPILSRVYVKSQEESSTPDEAQERWTSVDTTQRNRLPGWILDSHVGYPHTFVPVHSWPIEAFGFCTGDYCPDFRFTTAGAFTVTFPACFDGLCPDPPDEAECPADTEKTMEDGWVHCLSRGQLYRAGDAIRAGGPESYEFLYFNKRGQLCADPYTCQADGENRAIN